MKKVHFIGICGVGMSAVARLAQEHGWRVTGSDQGFYPPISDYLCASQIPYVQGYAAANIPLDTDMIVIGKHAKLVPEQNEEVRAAWSRGIPVRSFPEVLQEFTAHTDNYVVVGSFGKSTCTALAAWTLQQAGHEPGFFIGALPGNFPTNARHGGGKIFVFEGDEYPSANWDPTPKFLHFAARTVLLTSGEHDHFNVFPTRDSYLQPFLRLLEKFSGPVVACLDGENIPTIIQRSGVCAVTYGLHHPAADWRAVNIERQERIRFDLVFRGRKIIRLDSPLVGDHNVENMVGVAAWLLENDRVTAAQIRDAFATFTGVRRRLELKTRQSTVPVYEDFGSSRAKAKAGMTALRTHYPTRRLIAVFEPHTFSFRNRSALPWYEDLFQTMDVVLIYQPPLHGIHTHDQLTHHEIVAAVAQAGRDARAVCSREDILRQLQNLLQPADVLALITSGDLGGAIPDIVTDVENRFPL